jgi:outer membrane protein OmpA-like peptidoglycan-associated protein
MKSVSLLLFAAAAFLTPSAALSQPAETEIPGVTAEVVELRQAGGVLRLAVRYANGGATEASPSRFSVGEIVLVDVKSKQKHFPLKDADGYFIGGPIGDHLDGGRIVLGIPPGQQSVLWAYFEPLPAGTVVSVQLPQMFPFDDVPVTEGPGTLLSATSAKSTPGGAVATLVSAKRADQALNMRLKLAAEPGVEVDLRSPYFEYRLVYLFDPASKRKYPLLKDSEGFFQAQPLTVELDGGRFIPEWSNPILMSLTFAAPPDDVQTTDLVLPDFLPFESVAIEGLGGAASSGVAAGGKTLGLEGALKDLGAEVTETEIRIDLSADVLFDFDSADVKLQAEPSLQKVATVLKENPNAQVSIEGHTDGKGADDYNQTLSESRAASVNQWLVTKAQVDGANITTRGWGKSKPIAQNSKPDGTDDPDGRAKNRRVEIVVRTGA